MKRLFHKQENEEHNFWMSYTDLMSGFLVVFIILSAILYNHYKEQTEQAVIAKEKYNDASERLKKSSNSRDSLRLQVVYLQNIVDSLKHNDLKNLILQYKEVFVDDYSVKASLDTLRGSIILTHQKSGRDLFVSEEYYVKGDLRRYLDKVGKKIVLKTIELYNSGYDNIELRIEGHTDPRWAGYSEDGRFLLNLDLSSRRANKVYEYILKNTGLNEAQKRFVKEHMIGIGYSFSHRLLDGTEDDTSKDPSSRRIEFRIISK